MSIVKSDQDLVKSYLSGNEYAFNILIEKHKTGLPTERLEAVTNDITKLLDELNVVSKWQFNLTVLKNNICGI